MTNDVVYKNENVKYLRRYLGLTQKDFIEQYLSDGDGCLNMSIATLSNLEARGGKRLDEVILALSKSLGIEVVCFLLPKDDFIKKLKELIPEQNIQNMSLKGDLSDGGIEQNINKLTMYFAEKMLNHSLCKGDKIEPDRILAEKLGIGRAAVREALKVLEVMGMIDIYPGRGMFISNSEKNFFIIPLSWSLFLNGNQIENIIEMRHVLEVQAARLAADSGNVMELNHLHNIAHNMNMHYTNKDFSAFLADDVEFHLTIAKCSGNQVIHSMLQTISNLMKYVSGTGMVKEEQLRASYQEHQKIYGFIIAGDSDAASKSMEEHLKNSEQRYNL